MQTLTTSSDPVTCPTFLSFYSHKAEQKVTDSEVTSDEEEVGGDFTVYECPGLAPVGRHTHTHTYAHMLAKKQVISEVCCK